MAGQVHLFARGVTGTGLRSGENGEDATGVDDHRVILVHDPVRLHRHDPAGHDQEVDGLGRRRHGLWSGSVHGAGVTGPRRKSAARTFLRMRTSHWIPAFAGVTGPRRKSAARIFLRMRTRHWTPAFAGVADPRRKSAARIFLRISHFTRET
jgi:hypothetical protein